MAYKLIWSPAARDDLHDITIFIAHDDSDHAMSFVYRLISETDRLRDFPESGRIVPEYRNEIIREIIFPPRHSKAVGLRAAYHSNRSFDYGSRVRTALRLQSRIFRVS